MKVIQNDNTYRIITGNNVSMFDKLPAGTYIIRFDKMTGIYLELCSDYSINEKMYGKQANKVEKILSTFVKQDRNLGVLLSGDKGMGKSLTIKMVAIEAIKLGYPVIVIDSNISGLIPFLQNFDQEAIILIDEFEKIFTNSDDDDDDNSQNQFLSLFDGALSSAKKLFMMSCNEKYRISRYMIDRPGRIHYHIRFVCPTADEIIEYCNDHIEDDHKHLIPKIIELSQKANVSYDTLRAICFEINNLGGSDFKEIIKDLNIEASEEKNFKAAITIGNIRFETEGHDFDFQSYDNTIWLFNYKYYTPEEGHQGVRIKFDPKALVYDHVLGALVAKGNALKIRSFSNMDDETRSMIIKEINNSKLVIRTMPGEEDCYDLVV